LPVINTSMNTNKPHGEATNEHRNFEACISTYS
jgi:hypothetical protein